MSDKVVFSEPTLDPNYLSNLQLSISKLDDELIRLNADAINRRGTRKLDIKKQIKNIEEALNRKQQQLALYYNQPIPEQKTLMTNLQQNLEGINQITESFGLSGKSEEDIKNQDLDEITVTGDRTKYLIDKYKYYAIGALVLLIILFKFKKK